MAGALVGCALPLSELEAQLLKLHADAPGATPTAVRSMVLDLAARRSFAAKGGARHRPTLKPYYQILAVQHRMELAARRSFAAKGGARHRHTLACA